MNAASTPLSPASSQASSRAQSPLPVNHRQPNKFIQKIPPIIRYGLPGAVIGSVIPSIYNYIRSRISIPKNISYVQEKPKQEATPVSAALAHNCAVPAPHTTPIPKPTFDPKHPRTGFRYNIPFD